MKPGRIGPPEPWNHSPEVKKPVREDSVFSLFSVTKAFTNVLMFRAIERGEIALTTKVSQVIPEFAGHGRDDINYFDLMRVKPEVGRFFEGAERDDAQNAHPVVVINHNYWMSHYDGSPAAVG